MIQAPRHLQLAGWQAEHLGGGFKWSQVIWVLERVRCGNGCSFHSCISWTIEQLQPAAGFWTLGQLVGQGVSCHTHSEKYYYMYAPSISNAPATIKEFAETSLSTPIRELQSWEGLLWQKNNGRAKRVRASAAECNKWCSARPLQAQAPAAGHHQLLQEPHPPANVATIPTKWCSLESNTFQQRKWAAFRCALSNGCLLQS